MSESLTDIARKLNVAPSTISRAISSPEKVAPKTREKILSYIEKTGYRPNLSARNLRMQRSTTIGIVVNDLCDSLISKAANIMQDVAFQRGYFPVVLSTDESRTKEREAIDRLLDSNLCGLVIIPSSATASLLPKLKRIPVVELDRSTETNQNDEFRMDDIAAMQTATRYLIEQGCKHIAVLNGNIKRISSLKSRSIALLQCPSEVRYSTFFIKGVKADELTTSARYITNCILKTQGPNAITLAESTEPKENAETEFEDLEHSEDQKASEPCFTKQGLKDLLLEESTDLEQCHQDLAIDGLIATNHSIAAGIVQGFYDNQHSPEQKDIMLFTLDNPDWLDVLPYSIPTITHPLDHAALLAINRLIDRIERKCDDPVEARLIRPELVVRSK